MRESGWSAFVGWLAVGTVLWGGAALANGASEEKVEGEKKAPSLSDEWMSTLEWRSIGPANMSGRITSLAVYEADPSLWWAATASGGLLKTENNGITFEHQFDREATVSIGDVQVAQSDPDIVWVGTGESNPRNSVSWGNGVYKSVDGGESWQHMGLDATFQIGRIAIHPEDPEIVYVGALGRLWGRNEERGLFKTTDGGETWEKILYVDEGTGVIDVNLHPGDPNTLLVATYERQRDGFDTNDPDKKWGPGSGIWRSTDAGGTFERIESGLPSADLGRIDIEYYRAEPDVVYALVESSRIGEEPEDAPYIGIRGEDADVGARLTEITEGGPAEKAELQVGDIVIGIEGETVQSYEDLIAKVRRHLAGDTVQFEVSRDRESVLADVTFSRRPETREDRSPRRREGRRRQAESNEAELIEEKKAEAEAKPDEADAPAEGDEGGEAAESGEASAPDEEPEAATDGLEAEGAEGEADADAEAEEAEEADEEEEEKPQPRTPFRTGLGGQQPNIQDQQGPDGHEYGGLYKSTDGGLTWTRINSVNPRPMYFSQLRVDPSDDDHIYVLGISLYRSSDGGETFTGDGAGGGVHVDHHALWIDPNDGRHAILGNDGGVYVTYDRLDRWDHYNHVAIGQFYHVAVGPRENYWVYGGLQDNGTWGGPTNVRDGSGAINEDWISIGGGDGFVCQVDRTDPDLVYFESQNGGLGRRNLRTGERGFLRPEAERGKRLRWNWRTPFFLSAHNPGIYVTAGNYVFRSWLHGDDLERISPEISRTDRGSATVVCESPFDAGILYVGTDDGAIWRTQNGGNDWTDLFGPVKESEKIEATAIAASAPVKDENGDGNGHAETGEDAAEKDDAAAAKGPVTGSWILRPTEGSGGGEGRGRGGRRSRAGRQRGGGQGPSTTLDVVLKEDGSLSGTMSSRMGESEMVGGSFDAETGKIRMTFGTDFTTEIDASIDGEVMTGQLDFGGGRFQRDFVADRKGEEKKDRGDGFDWKPIAELVPKAMWVSSIEPSAFEEKRVYLTLDGHRSDLDAPYVFVSEDYGSTWRSLTGGLPEGCGSTRVLREDLENEDVLYLGTEFGAWVSIDRGATWTSMNTNLPTVAIHELAQHPTTGDIVAATHGRSLWVLDATPLRQLSKENVAASSALYEPAPVTYWKTAPRTGGTLRRFRGSNPASGAEIFYSLGKDAQGVSLVVKGLDGSELAELETSTEAGLHRASWNLRPGSSDDGNGRRRRRAPRVEPGTYLVELRVGNDTATSSLVVKGDPEFPEAVLWGVEYDEQMEVEALLMGGDEDELEGGGAADDEL